MASQIQGKSLLATANGIADGFVVLNPLVMKSFTQTTYKELHQVLKRSQRDIRSAPYPTHDILAIRSRNMKLQRIYAAIMVLEYSAKTLNINLV